MDEFLGSKVAGRRGKTGACLKGFVVGRAGFELLRRAMPLLWAQKMSCL